MDNTLLQFIYGLALVSIGIYGLVTGEIPASSWGSGSAGMVNYLDKPSYFLVLVCVTLGFGGLLLWDVIRRR